VSVAKMYIGVPVVHILCLYIVNFFISCLVSLKLLLQLY
jgi:hypothetical protein